MNRKFFITLLTTIGLATSGFAASAKNAIGIVDFNVCLSDSKLGKQEQNSFEALKNQMSSLVEDTEKQLNELAAKFNDADYMDGLSPDAEQEMQQKYAALTEEMQRYQNQFYQVLNQANARVVQTMGSNIQAASEKVAKNQKLNMVVNKEACFFFNDALDVTPLVIAELDKEFESNKQVAENAPAAK